MRALRKTTVLGILEKTARPRLPVAATPISGGAEGKEGPQGLPGEDGEDGKEGKEGAPGPAGTPSGIVYDTASQSAEGTGTLEWKHTPLIALPKGVLVLVAQNVTAADQISSVAYGGVEMAEVQLSPELHTEGSEDGALYGYFLGKGIPSGAQTVKVSVSGAAAKRAVCFTINGPGDTRVIDTTILDSAGVANPSLELTTRVGEECAVFGLLHSGQDAVTSLAAGEGFTDVFEHDFGSQTASWIRRTSNSTGGNVPVKWTATSEEAGVLGVAVGLVCDHGLVSALPAVAGRGDTCRLQAPGLMEEQGAVWDFIYTGAAKHPWTKIGGPPLRGVRLAEATTKSAAYVSLTEPIKLTAPVVGEYDIEVSFEGRPTPTASAFARLSYTIGAAGAGDGWAALNQTPSAGFHALTLPRKWRHEVKAGDLIEEKACTNGEEGHFARRQLWVDPVRVG